MTDKSPKSLFTGLKSTALLVGIAVLLLVSGFITSRTLRREPSTDTPQWSNVNASPGEVEVKTNDSESAPGARKPVTRSGNPLVKVWVNTKSGIYHCPDTPWYGDTKNGQYMMQKEAQAQGYRPAYGIVCG